jgi:hypothetical protein
MISPHFNMRDLIKWKEEEVCLLKKLFFLGKSNKEMGVALGRREFSVKAKVQNLGIKRQLPSRKKNCYKNQSKEFYDKFTELFLSGESNENIAKHFGMLIGQVIKYRRYLKIDTKLRKWTEEEDKILIKCVEKERSMSTIRRKLKRTTSSIINRFHTLGISYTAEIKRSRARRKIKSASSFDRCIRDKLASIRTRCNALETTTDLDFDFVKRLAENNNYLCYYSGVKLTPHKHCPNQLSVDRIDSSKGYYRNNVVICSWYINRMKQDSTVAEFYDLCSKVKANMDSCNNIEYFI